MSDQTQINALSPEARAVYERLATEWAIKDSAGQLTLLVAMQALDRMRQAQAVIAAEGIIKPDRFGWPKPHPATQVEKEARAGLLMALKALQLDLEALQPDQGGHYAQEA